MKAWEETDGVQAFKDPWGTLLQDAAATSDISHCVLLSGRIVKI